MQVVRDILAAHGYESAAAMEPGDHVEVELDSDAMMPLTIEKIGEDRLSVAHYYTQMGDLMSDPELVFRIENGAWTPVRYTQHPHLHQHDETGLPDVEAFAQQWSETLRDQGYVAAAEGDA